MGAWIISFANFRDKLILFFSFCLLSLFLVSCANKNVEDQEMPAGSIMLEPPSTSSNSDQRLTQEQNNHNLSSYNTQANNAVEYAPSIYMPLPPAGVGRVVPRPSKDQALIDLAEKYESGAQAGYDTVAHNLAPVNNTSLNNTSLEANKPSTSTSKKNNLGQSANKANNKVEKVSSAKPENKRSDEKKPEEKKKANKPSRTQVLSAGRALQPVGLQHPAWRKLESRLLADGVDPQSVKALIAVLPPPTQDPMGRKIRELYRSKFVPRKPLAPGQSAQRYYRGVVTQKNAQICRDYLALHKDAFIDAERKYTVPRYIAVSLLFVETRLGTMLGDVKENAFHVLASMAISDNLNSISEWLPKLPEGYEAHKDWIVQTLPKRAEWAYKETLALVRYMVREQLAPEQFPSSIYGAIGICQFMPSNINKFAADGNNDGKIDLFDDADAIASLSNYLQMHGWKKGINRKTQHKLLLTYNKSNMYANTILALGDLVNTAPKSAQSAPKSKKKS